MGGAIPQDKAKAKSAPKAAVKPPDTVSVEDKHQAWLDRNHEILKDLPSAAMPQSNVHGEKNWTVKLADDRGSITIQVPGPGKHQ